MKKTKNGRTVTDADLEEMAAQAEKSFDLSNWVLAPIEPGEATTGLAEATDQLREYRGQGRGEAWEAFAQGEAGSDPISAHRVRIGKRTTSTGSRPDGTEG
jgi:hypothetical protein